jgi:hypothetical protein
MAWLRMFDYYVNLDAVARIEFHNDAGRIRIELHGLDDKVIATLWVDYETAEKFKRGLDYLTKALPFYMAAEKEEVQEEKPPTEG